MDERSVKMICITGSFLSLLCIIVLSFALEPVEVAVCGLSSSDVGKTVSVSGTVLNPVNDEGNVFFTLQENGCRVKVVVWKDAISAMALRGDDTSWASENESVSLSGNVEVYRGNLEIVVSSPSVLKH